MAVVIPNTFLYTDDDAISYIRKKILNESKSVIVVSLPRGVFNPYTPTKTSVLFAYKKQDNEQAMEDVFFYVIRNDGFELGARRRPLQGQSDCNRFLMDYNQNPALRTDAPPTSITVSREEIISKNYSLFPFEYMEHLPSQVGNLGTIKDCIQERTEAFSIDSFADPDEQCAIISITQNGAYISDILSASELDKLSQKYKRVYPGDFAYNPHRINVGSIAVVPELHKNMFVSNIYPVFSVKQGASIPKYYLLKLLKNNEYKTIIDDYCLGGARADLKIEWLSKIKVSKPTKKEAEKIEKDSRELEKAYKDYLRLYYRIMND